MLTMALATLMSIVMFDAKVSLSGDDCDYILAADAFWHHFAFPGHHGSLYPIVLSPFVGLFGYRLVLLKFLSVLFTVGAFGFLYKAFERRIPSAVLIPSMLLAAICSYIFFYAGYTYSEPLFMLLQSIYFYFFSRYFWVEGGTPSYTLRKDWKKYLNLGALTLAMGLTREIGFCVIGVVILYFAIKGRWKDLLYTVGAALLMLAAFYLVKAILWPNVAAGHSFTNLMAKDYYNPNAGMEDTAGLLSRFWDNSRVYLSAFLCQMMGVMPETPSNRFDMSATRTLIIYGLYFAALVVILVRRDAPLLFAGLYAGVLNFASFVVLQIIWAQDRLITIYYPLILLFLLGALYYAFSSARLRRFFIVYPVVLLILLGGTLNITRNRVGRTLPVLQQNLLLGDPLYGFTPDWQNFIKASQWVATNTEKDAVIVSRKPSMSKVYTGRDFAGLPASLTVPADTLNYLKGDTGRGAPLYHHAPRQVHGWQYAVCGRLCLYLPTRKLSGGSPRDGTDGRALHARLGSSHRSVPNCGRSYLRPRHDAAPAQGATRHLPAAGSAAYRPHTQHGAVHQQYPPLRLVYIYQIPRQFRDHQDLRHLRTVRDPEADSVTVLRAYSV